MPVREKGQDEVAYPPVSVKHVCLQRLSPSLKCLFFGYLFGMRCSVEDERWIRRRIDSSRGGA